MLKNRSVMYMARKDLSDFNYDYQAFANYLESAECANDDGYDTYVDHKGNIYESEDWTKGHGHKNVYNGYERSKDDERSNGREWKNPWLKYDRNLNLSEEEINILNENHNYTQSLPQNEKGKKLILSNKR